MLGDDGPEHLDGAAVGRGDLDRPVGVLDRAVGDGAVGAVRQDRLRADQVDELLGSPRWPRRRP